MYVHKHERVKETIVSLGNIWHSLWIAKMLGSQRWLNIQLDDYKAQGHLLSVNQMFCSAENLGGSIILPRLCA